MLTMIKIGIIGYHLTACITEALITSDIEITNTEQQSNNYDCTDVVTILPMNRWESDREEVIHALDTLNDLGLEPRKVFGLYGKVSPRRGNVYRRQESFRRY